MQLNIAVMLGKVKRALASRYLFDNWYSLLIKYVLARLGISVKLKAKVDSCVIDMDPDVFARLVSRYYRGLIKSVKCIDGRLFVNDVEVNSISDVIYDFETWAKIIGWRYDESFRCWVKDGVKFKHLDPIILSVILSVLGMYGEGEYAFLDVTNRDVVDVGAYIGDSAIYFALRGARRIIAIELHPEAFKEMIENIKLNNLENVIILVNAGLASKPGEICIEKVDVEGTIGTYHRPGECDVVVPAITLADVVSKYGVNHDAILKMDCEGCEFDVILNDYEHVRMFKEIVFEYHLYASSEPLSKLLKVLARDYRCNVKRSVKNIGMMYCLRELVGECVVKTCENIPHNSGEP